MKVITFRKTDCPVALVTCDEKPCELLYYSDEYIPVKPPRKVLRMMEEYGIKPPGYENYECDYPIEKLQPVFRNKERITMFIAGCQNCGKSYYISNFLKTYRAFHPDRPVFLVTGLSEKDKHFEGQEMWKINLSHVPASHWRTSGGEGQVHPGQGAL